MEQNDMPAVNEQVQPWHLAWAHGSLDLHARGGMLGGVRLKVGPDQWITPLYEAPWIGSWQADEPTLLENLRSEFVCLPFGGGYAADAVVERWQPSMTAADPQGEGARTDDSVPHGYCADADWTLVTQTDHAITIAVDYSASSPIARLTRTVQCDPSSAAIDFSLTIESRRVARRPVGLHPNIVFPARVGALRIEPGVFQFGMVHPAGPETGVSRAVPGGIFEDLAAVPLLAGATAPFDRLPFAHDTEEIVQLCGVDGSVSLFNDEENTVYQLRWDAHVLPSLLLWMSNRGRAAAPWSSRNLCLGVEPVASAFDLGTGAALAPNPINEHGVLTALTLDPSTPTTIRYRFSAARQ
jgi:hypothetical protein